MPLLGRELASGQLRDAIARLHEGRGGLVLITGEAGIGKTALVREAVDAVPRDRVLVLTGACWAAGSTPGFWPWVQVVRGLARSAPTRDWTEAAAAAGDALPVLLGETGPPASDGETASAFRLRDAFTTLLVTAARTRPIAIVLEDLHWADVASLQLLDFLTRHAWFEPVLVIGTYRDVELESAEHPARTELLSVLRAATTVRLGGLEPDDVGALIADITGTCPDPDQVAAVHRRTGGNPFFVEQTARLGPDTPLAAGVRGAVQQRLALLPDPAVALLRTASVIGNRFAAGLLAAVGATPRDAVDTLLEPAVTTRIVTRLADGGYAFTHDLVRDVLVAGCGDDQLRSLHAAILRALLAARPRASATVIAHHARRGVPQVAAGEAIEHLLAAADDASIRQAAEEAARHYRAALDLADPAHPRDRAGIELRLAAQLDRAGELATARETLTGVLESGRALDDAELVARAVLGLHRMGNPEPNTPYEVDLIDEARDRLERHGGADAALTASVLAAASMARTHAAVDMAVARELSRSAIALARGHDDTLGWCLLAHHDAIWGPGTAAARIDVLDELTAVARRAANRELESLAAFLRTIALLERGDPRGHDEFAVFEALTARTRLPRHRYLAMTRRAALDTLAGRFDAARALVGDALAFGEHVGELDRKPMWRDQVWALEMLRGDLPAALTVARTSTPGDMFVEVLEALASDHPALERVEAVVRGMASRFASTWTVVLARTAAISGDAELCARAHAVLAPVIDEWAVFSGGVVVLGPMAYWSARVHAAQGEWAAAVAGFGVAVAAAERMGARPWVVLATAHLAAALRARGVPGDGDAAAVASASARQEAAALGMAVEDGPPEPAEAAGPDEPRGNVFRSDGQVWTLRYGARTVRLPDAKGLHDLRTLLARPGVEVPVADLLAPARAAEAIRPRPLGADAVLDDQARAAYRARLQALDTEIRDALERQNDRRAAALDGEREALLDELRRATGLGGRARRLGDETERARQAVTARIRHTVRKLRDVHPELAAHLEAAITTGAHCRYQPPTPTAWAY